MHIQHVQRMYSMLEHVKLGNIPLGQLFTNFLFPHSIKLYLCIPKGVLGLNKLLPYNLSFPLF